MKEGSYRQRKFVELYYKYDGDEVRAYKLMFPTNKLSEEEIADRSFKFLWQVGTQRELEIIRERAVERAEIKIADVLRNWVDIASADPNDLISFRRTCCRHCHGDGHVYQWIDAEEWASACAAALAADERAMPPSMGGGFGFDPTEIPHDGCPRCFGQGVGDVHITDTRMLTGPAAKLYAGMEVTARGMKLLMRDQDRAAENIAKHLGMFIDRKQLSGPNGGPMSIATSDPVEAARIYQQMMQATVDDPGATE